MSMPTGTLHTKQDLYTYEIQHAFWLLLCMFFGSSCCFDNLSKHQKGGGVSRWGVVRQLFTSLLHAACFFVYHQVQEPVVQSVLVFTTATSQLDCGPLMHLMDPIKVHVTYT